MTYEQKMDLLLTETSCVGAHPFKHVVDEMYQWLCSQIGKQQEYNSFQKIEIRGEKVKSWFYKYTIPNDITSKFTWIETLQVNINNYELFDYNNTNLSGNGATTDFPDILYNGKMSWGLIMLTTFSVNRKLIPQTFYSTIYHELNHLWETYSLAKKDMDTEAIGDFKDKNNYPTIHTNINGFQRQNINNNTPLQNFSYLVYTLFMATEVNAEVASVYGDLQVINGNNWEKDKTHVEAYKIYDLIKNSLLDKIYSYDDETWRIFAANFYKQYKELKTFKNRFYREAQQRLNTFYYKITKTAKFYYNEKNGQQVNTGEKQFEKKEIENLIRKKKLYENKMLTCKIFNVEKKFEILKEMCIQYIPTCKREKNEAIQIAYDCLNGDFTGIQNNIEIVKLLEWYDRIVAKNGNFLEIRKKHNKPRILRESVIGKVIKQNLKELFME